MAESIGAGIVPLPEKRVPARDLWAEISCYRANAEESDEERQRERKRETQPSPFPHPCRNYSPCVNADRLRNQSREKDFTENSNTKNVVGLWLFGPFNYGCTMDIPIFTIRILESSFSYTKTTYAFAKLLRVFQRMILFFYLFFFCVNLTHILNSMQLLL